MVPQWWRSGSPSILKSRGGHSNVFLKGRCADSHSPPKGRYEDPLSFLKGRGGNSNAPFKGMSKGEAVMRIPHSLRTWMIIPMQCLMAGMRIPIHSSMVQMRIPIHSLRTPKQTESHVEARIEQYIKLNDVDIIYIYIYMIPARDPKQGII